MTARTIPTARDRNPHRQTSSTGMPNLPATLTSLSVLGTTYTMADLKTKLGTYKAVFDAADKARTAASAAEEAVQEIAVEANEFVSETKAAFKAALGRKSVALETVGVTPDKTPAPLPPDKELAKVAKAKATRAARHHHGQEPRRRPWARSRRPHHGHAPQARRVTRSPAVPPLAGPTGRPTPGEGLAPCAHRPRPPPHPSRRPRRRRHRGRLQRGHGAPRPKRSRWTPTPCAAAWRR